MSSWGVYSEFTSVENPMLYTEQPIHIMYASHLSRMQHTISESK